MEPTVDLRRLIEESDRLWNEGNREEWEQLWRSAVPGEFVLESPVGSEPVRGFDATRLASWDQHQATTRCHNKELIVCGNSVAALTENEMTVDGQSFIIMSIDCYEFDGAGNCYERNYFSMS